MMNPRTHRRLTAWLGMIAIWLIMLVPAVSQSVVAAREPVKATCTMAGMSFTDMTASSADTQDAHGSGMIACGYCDLLATHATLPTVAAPLPVLVMLVTSAPVPALSTRFTPLGVFPSGRPRAPPLFSLS
ncbi:DUF2946 domain-containing protein [Paraburkholderia adhaesiva]|uniref:DUF2946 domain-containing protein n=1 Tax=Paraburkholderia adhaesiva TaxID=2883244 RepID=UPI001F3DB33D|nr:DUF2946 domain-containing protein [Paraburkholderia adhaesiva]